MKQWAVLPLFSLYALHSSADTLIQEQQREQQRQQQFQQQMQPDVDVRLPTAEAPTLNPKTLPQNEQPCFAIDSISLVGDASARFQFALDQAVKRLDFKPGMCLGVEGINALTVATQNAVIGQGYTTTRILTAPQDLKTRHLELTVIPGRIHQIRYEREDAEQTHVGRISAFGNELPNKAGDILNLRDIEQALENFKRVPTADADIQIVPADAPNESDIVIRWSQRLVPLRVALNVDDSGSRSTGKYQGGITLSLDNPLGLSDLFYVNVNRDLGHKDRYVDDSGHTTNSGTHGYAVHYSFPVGKWLWSYNQSFYRYHQAVAGLNENYDYNGNSRNRNFGVSRLLFRNGQRKVTLGAKLWTRESRSFINDAELDVQYRRTGGWLFNLDHTEYLGNAVLGLSLGYKKGTGFGNSIAAPEEDFGEGTSRMEVITADVSLAWPFQLGTQRFHYDGSIHAQWNRTPLVPQDKLAIGGRYTVRGFDGELSLSAERGAYWQNTLGWRYHHAHQLYVGIDAGHVAGDSAEYLVGKTLVGSVMGLKGQVKAGGQLYYDLFVGKPIKKPHHFQTKKTTMGFSLNYTF